MDAISVQIVDELPWINPVGGYGDMLMVSGVLKQAYEKNRGQYNLIRRTRYSRIFKDHEAINTIGHPLNDSKVQHVSYWSMADLDGYENRPYQILARSFGLDTPVDENLYLPGIPDFDPILFKILAKEKLNVVIAPASDSPRKTFRPEIWHELVNMLSADDVFVMQAGLLSEVHIKNAYSLQGITTPQQLAALIKHCDLVITVDNFVMHLAHMQNTPAVVIWGATQNEIYGYSEQVHLQNGLTCNLNEGESCLISDENRGAEIYMTPCPLGINKHCMNQITPRDIYNSCAEVLYR